MAGWTERREVLLCLEILDAYREEQVIAAEEYQGMVNLLRNLCHKISKPFIVYKFTKELPYDAFTTIVPPSFHHCSRL